MAEFNYKIEKQIGLVSKNGAYSKEVNLISYNGAPAKIDIRNWTEQEDGSKRMGKGITLTFAEAKSLANYLAKIEAPTKKEDEPIF